MPAKSNATCPNPETLKRYRLGLLPVGEAAELRLHESKCPECAQALELMDEEPGADEEPTQHDLPRQVGQRPRAKPPSSATDAIGGSAELRGTPVLRPPEQPGEVGRLGSYRILKLLSQGG